MDLKEKLIASFLAFENQVDIDLPVHDVRSEAIKIFEDQGFPSKRDEAWKYTSLNSILKLDYSVFPKQENAIEYSDVKKYFIHDIDTYKNDKFLFYQTITFWKDRQENYSYKSMSYHTRKLKRLNKEIGFNSQETITQLLIEKGKELQL